jgi:hypothetical protein
MTEEEFEQWERELNDAHANAEMDAAFDEHLQAQIDEQMAVEQHIFEAQLRTCGTPPQDLFIENTSVSPSSEEQLFHQIISDERDTNSKVQY